MKIGDLAAATRTPVETIRFYEREQLLPVPQRTVSNYRIYAPAHVEQLAFIRHCRSLDMTLDEIRVLLRVKDQPLASCAEVNALLDAHIGHVAHRIQELKTLETHLQDLRQQCSDSPDAEHCGILNELTQASSVGAALGGAKTPRRRDSAAHVHGSHAHGTKSTVVGAASPGLRTLRHL